MSNGTMKLGRRARKTQATRSRIFAAARGLFGYQGFDAVTVQAIAERADLAVGTLFYYASSKTELLFLVYNAELKRAIEEGEADAAALPPGTGVPERIAALVMPLAEGVAGPQAENLTRYHRELLFGASDDTHRREGIDLVRRLESHIATVLGDAYGVDPKGMLARLAARAIFAALHFDIALPNTDLNPATRFASAGGPSILMQIEIVTHGVAASAHMAESSHDDLSGRAGTSPTSNT